MQAPARQGDGVWPADFEMEFCRCGSLTGACSNADRKFTEFECSVAFRRSVNVWSEFNAFELDKETNGKSLTEVRPEMDRYVRVS